MTQVGATPCRGRIHALNRNHWKRGLELANSKFRERKVSPPVTNDISPCFLGKNTRYWHDGQGGNAIDVETTSYALLTQMVLNRRGYAGAIVVWLTEQRRGGGGFVSTQVDFFKLYKHYWKYQTIVSNFE